MVEAIPFHSVVALEMGGAFARTRANTHSCRMKPRHGWGTRIGCVPRWVLIGAWGMGGMLFSAGFEAEI
jgi:hypothetical protein